MRVAYRVFTVGGVGLVLAGCGGLAADGPDDSLDQSATDAGGGASGPARWQSGSRLHIRLHRVDTDELAEFQGFHDTELDTACEFRVASDGAERCLPSGISQSYFADSACSVPLGHQLAVEGCAPAPLRYALGKIDPAGPSRIRVHPVGAELHPATVYYRPSGGACTATAAPVGYVLYAVGPEIPPETFVEGTLEPAPGDARLRDFERSTADGARGPDPFGKWDSAREERCTFQLTSAGTARCLPSGLSTTGMFADPMCKREVGGVFGWDRVSQTVLRWEFPPGGGSGTVSNIYAAGIQVTALYFGSTNGTTCAGGDPVPAGAYYRELGPEIAFGDFMSAQERISPTGRLAQVEWLAEDGSAYPVSATYFDSQRRERCSLSRAADGSLRCLPIDAADIYQWYSDAACTIDTPAATVYTAAIPPALVRTSDCDELRHVHQVGAPLAAGARLYWKGAGSCTELAADPNRRVYPLGPEIPASAFAPAVETIE